MEPSDCVQSLVVQAQNLNTAHTVRHPRCGYPSEFTAADGDRNTIAALGLRGRHHPHVVANAR